MTKNESFKRRVRERMAHTGERYAAARASLIEQVPPGRRRTWVSEPEVNDEVITAQTERSWDDWCDLVEAWPGHVDGHPAIAAYVEREHGLDGWWSQCVTVGYERIVGLRLPYQRADGTFTAGKSMTVAVDAARLRAMLLDPAPSRSGFRPHRLGANHRRAHQGDHRSRTTADARRSARVEVLLG